MAIDKGLSVVCDDLQATLKPLSIAILLFFLYIIKK
jgi:hypothetical protein